MISVSLLLRAEGNSVLAQNCRNINIHKSVYVFWTNNPVAAYPYRRALRTQHSCVYANSTQSSDRETVIEGKMRRDPESCKVVRVSFSRRCKSLVKNVLVKYQHNSMLSLFETITKNSGSSGQTPVFYNFVIIVKSFILICNFSRFSN